MPYFPGTELPANDLPSVVSDSALSNSSPSELIQVCVARRDYKRTMEGMVRLGIRGPRSLYRYHDTLPSNALQITKIVILLDEIPCTLTELTRTKYNSDLYGDAPRKILAAL